MNRREFIAAGLGAVAVTASADPLGADVTQFVNPFIGTGGHGHCYPGATVPFGMVQLSPDTFNDGWDWCSGYHTSDTSIMGFSHTHLSGTGVGDMLDFLLMPSTREIQFDPGPRENPDLGYRSRFSHSGETAEPGYYSVCCPTTGFTPNLPPPNALVFTATHFHKARSPTSYSTRPTSPARIRRSIGQISKLLEATRLSAVAAPLAGRMDARFTSP